MKIFNISRQTFKNFSYLGGTHIFLMIIGLVTSAIWARYTTVEVFGKYQLLLSFISMAAIFSIPGFNMSAQLSAAKEKHGNLQILFKKKIYWSFLSTVLLTAIGLYYQVLKNDNQIAYMLYIVAFVFPLYNLRSIWEGWLIAINEYKKLSLIQLYFGLVSLVSLLISLVLIGNIYLVIIVTFSTIALSNVFIIKYFQKKVVNNIEDNELINYGYKLSLTMFIPIVMSFDKFIISEYLSIKDVAIYSIAIIFPMYIKPLNVMIHRIMAPHISAVNSIDEAWNYTKTKLFRISVLFLIIGVVGFYTLEYAIKIIYSMKYEESTLYAKWLWLSIILTIPTTYIANILRTQQKLKFSFYYEAFNSLGKVAGFLILIPIYELWGAIYGLITVNILSSIFIVCYFIYEYKKEMSL